MVSLHATPPHGAGSGGGSPRVARAWQRLGRVLDPEVPVLSVVDLGLVRDIVETPDDDALEVVVTPTYSGCPATEVIEASIVQALDDDGLGPVRVRMQRAPAWTTDWISAEGRTKLNDYGIAPPGPVATDGAVPIRIVRPKPRLACPRCASTNTEEIAGFGATACKSLWRCLACREPFEHFKAI